MGIINFTVTYNVRGVPVIIFFHELRQPSNFVEIVFNMYAYLAGGGVADSEHKLGE